MREQILDELIQMDTWDWWKALIYELREQRSTLKPRHYSTSSN